MRQHYSKKTIIVLLMIFFIATIGISFTYTHFKVNPFENIHLTNTSGVALGEDHSIYIVSDSNRAIRKIANNDQLIYTIEGGKRTADSFYTANEIDTDENGNLYVMHSRWDDTGSYLETETISVFDNTGKFIKQVFKLPDESQSKLTPAMKGLKYFEGHLYWFVLVNEGINLYSDKSEEPMGFFAFEMADQMIQDVDMRDETHWFYASKQGFIQSVDTNKMKVQTLFDARLLSQENPSSIWGIQYDAQSKTLFFNDLGQFGLFKINGSQVEKVFSSSEYSTVNDEVYYNFDVLSASYIAVNDESITLKSEAGAYKSISELKPSSSILILRIIAWVSIFLMILSAYLLINWLLKDVLKNGIPRGFKKTAAIILVVLIATILTSSLAINFYNEILVEQATNNLKLLVQGSKFVIHGDAVDAIKQPSDFYTEEYQVVYDDLQRMVNYNQEVWDENLYTALYTITDDRYYALMYNDNSVTPYYTFNAWTDDPDFNYFYDAFQGKITHGTETDADGEWLFAMGPVYNSKDEVVAIIEVGMNKYIFDEWNKNIVNKIITDIISITIIIILLISEVTFLSNWLEQRKAHRLQSASSKAHEINPEFNELNALRTLALLTYIVIFMCTAFIPLMAKSIYSPIGNLSMSMAIGLPIFTEVLFAAITIVIAGFIAEKKGWKLIFYMGIIILIGAAIATALTRSLLVFIIIRGIAGIGNGFIQMTMHAFVNTGKTVAQRNETFANMMSGAIAGVNLGVVFGANLVDKMGYFNVFFIMAGIGVIAILFERLFLRQYDTMAFHIEEAEPPITEDTLDKNNQKMSWLYYFSRKSIAAFLTLILVPALLCYMYLEYFFPLFAEAKGLTTSMIGIVFSLYGLFIVYFGPSMSTFTEKTFGVKNASAIASILTGISLLVYAVTGTLLGAVLAVLILAISDSFGDSVYTTYFLAIKESQKIGKSIAAGYLEFFSQIGKMLGALAFGIAIGFGDQLGIGIIGVITVGFGVLFIPIGTQVVVSDTDE
ncbi:MFS transporter [Fusibacter sp. 3D3]|uniref:MFS transporter n=1 Tax=Fusibacter sp. 3D3 TaxID=1048380 RepID=UPI000852EA9D|nr:MFS transporter [Fusibacter sp. 3D3]GAU77490.1 putative inner membrane transport protein [Fusibacter sp. 3D3]